jgi:hypothetical protein
MRKQHVYFSKHTGGINGKPNPNYDALEHNQYGYTFKFVRWFYTKVSTDSNVYKDIIIKRRYPAGGCVERTSQAFDIAAPKETWNIALVDYAKELGAKWLDAHPNGAVEQDDFGNWCYITKIPYTNERGYVRVIEASLFNDSEIGLWIGAESPDVFDVLLRMAKSNKIPLLIDNRYYFFYNRDM